MKSQTVLPRALRSPLARTAVPWLLMAVVAASPWNSARAASAAEMGMADLERAFWVCDYAATHERITVAAAAACSQYTEALTTRKFNGELEAMLEWWRARKPAEHAALGRVERASSPRLAGKHMP